jgi:resuscitation-promoting factor RpfA
MVHSVLIPGRSVLRLAVVGAVTLGAPVALAESAEAGPGGRWDRLAKCESSGNWSTDSGNGYYGGLQFSRSTWKAFGGEGMPHRASRSQQIKVAERVLRTQGWKAWPACSRKLGYR